MRQEMHINHIELCCYAQKFVKFVKFVVKNNYLYKLNMDSYLQFIILALLKGWETLHSYKFSSSSLRLRSSSMSWKSFCRSTNESVR